MDKITKVKNNLQLQRWAQMVTERQNTGMTVAQWCEHEQISKSVYYYRLRKVRESICEQIAVPIAEIPAAETGKVICERSDGKSYTLGEVWGITEISGIDAPNFTLYSEYRASGTGTVITGASVSDITK